MPTPRPTTAFFTLLALSISLVHSPVQAKTHSRINALAKSAKPNLSGRILSSTGQPIAGAAVMIYTAKPRIGVPHYCPSCYADCAKRVLTDADGRFQMTSLDPTLVFNVLVVKSGWQPTFQGDVDPLKGEINVSLPPRSDSSDAHHFISGRVLGSLGAPVVGAKVTPAAIEYANGGGSMGTIEDADPVAVTDDKGEFAIECKPSDAKLQVIVEARGLASGSFGYLKSGSHTDLKLTDGGTVNGQVLKNGKPLANVTIGLVQANREVETFFGPQTIGTDAQGRFQFQNVAPGQDFFLYATMAGMSDQGAIISRKITVGADDSTYDAGKISVSAAHHISGRVTLTDGAKIPPGTQVVLGRIDAWDAQLIDLDAQGNYTITSLPGETLQVSVTVPGYELSPHNPGFDASKPYYLTIAPTGGNQIINMELAPKK